MSGRSGRRAHARHRPPAGRLRGAVVLVALVGVALGGQAGSGAAAGTRVVERGETLSGLAKSLGVSVDELARANGITDVNYVRAGRRLSLPGSAAAVPSPASPVDQAGRVVRRGETMSGVARSLGVSVAELARANGIADVDRLRAGRRLVVPVAVPTGTGASPAVVVPAAAPAAAPVGPTRVVGRGETLSAVARSLGVSLADLARANGIADVDHVRAGRRLVVPTTAAAVPEPLRALPDRLALLPVFDAAAREFDIPGDLFKALAWQESGWRNDRVSSASALGIGQLMPDTIAFVNGALLRAQLDPNRPEDNIRMSARFLAYLLDRNGGDQRLALASYYQGLASVRSRGLLPQTERYVANVLALRSKF